MNVDAQVAVQVHPPERRRRPQAIAPCCCCCCCCCCLHTLGGLVGAAAGSRVGPCPPADLGSPDETARGDEWLARKRASGIYWGVLAILSLLTLALGGLGAGDTSFFLGLLILLVAAPAVQLLASLAAAIIFALSGSGWTASGLKTIGRITWMSLVGTLIGAAGLYVLFLGMSR